MTRPESYWRRFWNKLGDIRGGKTLKPKRGRVECLACGKTVTQCNNGNLIKHKCVSQIDDMRARIEAANG